MSSGQMKLRPLGNRVLLRKIESDEVHGFKVPETADREEGTQEYEVLTPYLFVLDPDHRINFLLDVGSRVYLAMHKPWKIQTRDGEVLYAADVDDILAVEDAVIDRQYLAGAGGCDRPGCYYATDADVHRPCGGEKCVGTCATSFDVPCHSYQLKGNS